MPPPDILAAATVMALLFLRYVFIYKDPLKINYAPVVLGIAVVGSLLHVAAYSAGGNEWASIKEALLLLASGVILWTLMSVLSGSAWAKNIRDGREETHGVMEEMRTVRRQLEGMNASLEAMVRIEDSEHEQLRRRFQEEIDALNVIQANQKLFIAKIESLLAQQQTATEKFEEFAMTEIPGLDNVVHRHIDLLRIAEQDHFNQLKNSFKSIQEERSEVAEHFVRIADRLAALEHKEYPSLEKELHRIAAGFGDQIHVVGSKVQSIVTGLMENDARIQALREQSELIMQQMVLSSKQMRELTVQSKDISDTFKPLKALFASAEALHRDVSGVKEELETLLKTLCTLDTAQYAADVESLHGAVNDAIAKLHSLTHHLNAAQPPLNDPKNVRELANRVKLHKSYVGENQE